MFLLDTNIVSRLRHGFYTENTDDSCIVESLNSVISESLDKGVIEKPRLFVPATILSESFNVKESNWVIREDLAKSKAWLFNMICLAVQGDVHVHSDDFFKNIALHHLLELRYFIDALKYAETVIKENFGVDIFIESKELSARKIKSLHGIMDVDNRPDVIDALFNTIHVATINAVISGEAPAFVDSKISSIILFIVMSILDIEGVDRTTKKNGAQIFKYPLSSQGAIYNFLCDYIVFIHALTREESIVITGDTLLALRAKRLLPHCVGAGRICLVKPNKK